MKRLRILITSILLPLTVCACGAPPSSSPLPSGLMAGPEGGTRIGALKGATTIGMAQMIDRVGNGGWDLSFEIVTTDEIVPLLVRGEIDMAAIPANLAATLYNNTNGAVRVVAINTLGLTYIVETGDAIQSIQDLRGKTVIATGKSAPPEITLRHILTQNGIDPDKDLTLEFKSAPAEVVAHLKQNGGIAMLQQPFVTTAMDNAEGLREALDLAAEWDKISSGPLIIGVFVARTAFIEAYPDVLPKTVLPAYKESVEWVRANPAEAAPLVEKLGITPADVAERAIPKCHLTFTEGAEMREMLSAYLGILFEAAPESVGGALPGDDFYYVP